MSVIDLDTLPHPDFLPIPDEIEPGEGWTPVMHEIAAHIGPRLTLEFVRRFGGQFVLFPGDASRGRFGCAIGEEASRALCKAFARERVLIPTGKAALARARRQGVLARVRAGELNLTEAAIILRTSRRYMTQLVNQSSEGVIQSP